MKNVLKIGVVTLGLALGACGPVLAQKTVELETIQPVAIEGGSILLAADDGEGNYDNGGGASISARQAGQIAKSQVPGSKVLKVTLLSSGVYAVTLRGNGELTRILVDGQTGAIQ